MPRPFRVQILLLLTFLIFCPALVQANIGDTVLQLRGRYGSAKEIANQMLFQHDGYSICVYFDGEYAAMEVFVRDGSKPDKTDITEEDIKDLLKKESGKDGWAWTESQSGGKRVFLRADGRLVARLSVGDKPDDKFLTIMVNSK